MASFRVTASGEVEIFAHRLKSVGVIAICAVFTAVALWALTEDPRLWFAWLGLGLFGVGGAFFVYRQLRSGLLTGRPALVLGPAGLRDRTTGLHVRWEHVESAEVWEQHVRGTTQRYLGLWTNPEAPATPGPLGSALSGLVLGDRPPLNIPLNLLAVTAEELAGLLRRYWQGPIGGIVSDEQKARPPRWRRFLGWAGGWLLTFALGIALAVVLVLVLESC